MEFEIKNKNEAEDGGSSHPMLWVVHDLITMESRVVHWVVRSFFISPFIVGHTLLSDFPIYSPHSKQSKNRIDNMQKIRKKDKNSNFNEWCFYTIIRNYYSFMQESNSFVLINTIVSLFCSLGLNKCNLSYTRILLYSNSKRILNY